MPIASQRGRGDERAALFPPQILPLVDDEFVQSCDLIEEYVGRIALEVFRSTGLADACSHAVTVDEAVARAGLSPTVARLPAEWILATLARRGWLESLSGAGGDARYRLTSPLPALDPQEILDAQALHDAHCLPSYRIVALAAEHYPAVLRGDTTGEEALFAPERISAWVEYFSNANSLYAINNAIGAIAVEHALPEAGGAVLEIGGGLGSAAEAFLERLEAQGRGAAVSSYRFTEILPAFLRRAKQVLSARFPGYPLTFGWLDIDRPFAEGGVAPGTYSLVYGVNVLHVARDLAATLGEIRATLAHGGALVVSECVRPFPRKPLYVEFVFNLLGSFRAPVLVPNWRPDGGFLTPEQWTLALEANGFTHVRIVPDIAAIREAYPSFVVAAIVARRA